MLHVVTILTIEINKSMKTTIFFPILIKKNFKKIGGDQYIIKLTVTIYI